MKKDENYRLLVDTKGELNYLVSCILQTSLKDATRFVDMLGKATIAKISSFSATAGMGTIIAGLQGTSATSSLLAWLGGMVSFGMVTGSVLTGGLGVFVGILTYKMLSSKAREYSFIGERERYFVDSCIILAKYIDEWLAKGEPLKTDQLKSFSQNSLAPLIRELALELDDLIKSLDTKNSILLKAHITLTLQRYLKEYEKLEFIEEGHKCLIL